MTAITAGDQQMVVTDEQRAEFLRRRGWRDDLSQEVKDQIEQDWPTQDIAEALAMGW